MTNAEGLAAVEPAVESAPLEGQVAETPEVKVEEKEVKTSPEAETDGAGEQAPEKTVEERLTEAEQAKEAMQKKIDRQTAANRKAQELYEKQRQENEKLQALIKEQEPEKEPSIDDFDTVEDYNTAVKEYIAKQAKAEAQQEFLAQQQRAQQEQLTQERLKLRQAQEAEYMAENPLYKAAANEVGEYIKNVDVSLDIGDAVINQLYKGNVPQVIDHFGANNGENLDQLGEILQMTAPEAAVEIYKIQQKLAVTPTKKETKTPVTPVKTERGGSKVPKTLSKMSGSEILDWVNKKR